MITLVVIATLALAQTGVDGQEVTSPFHIIEADQVIWAWGSGEQTKGSARPDVWTSITTEQLLYKNANLTKLTFLNVHLPEIPQYILPRQLTDVAIANCDLASLPMDLIAMTRLERLDLNRNNLKTFEPPTTYPFLQQITMQENALETFNVTAPGLVKLDLRSNLLTEIPPCIYSMIDLVELYLSNNSIPLPVYVTPDEFEFLTGLDYFYMDPIDITNCPGDSQLHILKGNKLCVTNTPSSSPDVSSIWTYSVVSWILLISGILEAIVGIGVYLIYRKQKQWRQNGLQYTTTHTTSSGGERERLLSMEHVLYASMGSSFMPMNMSLVEALDSKTQRLDCDALSLDKRLAQGGYGEVWLGHYHSSFVAIKLLLPEKRSTKDIEAFIREIVLLASLEHPHILHCIGVAWPKSKRDLMLVTEYVAGGDLRALLDIDTTHREWPRTKIQYALDIAQAMAYMHGLDIVHRDLKTKNVLIDPSNNGAKICDFGVAAHIDQLGDPCVVKSSCGTSRWIAPEVLTGDNFTKASDVYAFGMVLAELDSHQIPFAFARTPSGNDMTNMEILKQVVRGTLKPTFGDTCPPEIADLASFCLHPNPKARPSAAVMVDKLSSLVDAFM
ncbi:hypothetical protein LEN26_001210 [Aphanomyces euteiches]|nr:hypothetical protein LEN26_001210 [Aphanomyces euteiches]